MQCVEPIEGDAVYTVLHLGFGVCLFCLSILGGRAPPSMLAAHIHSGRDPPHPISFNRALHLQSLSPDKASPTIYPLAQTSRIRYEPAFTLQTLMSKLLTKRSNRELFTSITHFWPEPAASSSSICLKQRISLRLLRLLHLSDKSASFLPLPKVHQTPRTSR
jgi:hypothetical protein